MVDLEKIAHKKLSDANLTVQDLLALIKQIVNEHVKVAQQGPLDSAESGTAEWWQSMITEIIVPGSGTPSATDMLREERDQWYKPS